MKHVTTELNFLFYDQVAATYRQQNFLHIQRNPPLEQVLQLAHQCQRLVPAELEIRGVMQIEKKIQQLSPTQLALVCDGHLWKSPN